MRSAFILLAPGAFIRIKNRIELNDTVICDANLEEEDISDTGRDLVLRHV